MRETLRGRKKAAKKSPLCKMILFRSKMVRKEYYFKTYKNFNCFYQFLMCRKGNVGENKNRIKPRI